MPRIRDIAKVVRSKNAGPFYLTIDIVFPNQETYQRVYHSGIINKETICSLYNSRSDQVKIIYYEMAYAIKVTIDRPVPAADVKDTDIYGTQMHAPLLDLEISEEVRQNA